MIVESGGDHFLSRNISCNIAQSIFHEMLIFSLFSSWLEVPLVILDLGKFLIIAKSDGGQFLIISRHVRQLPQLSVNLN